MDEGVVRLATVLGPGGGAIARAMAAGGGYLRRTERRELLARVGERVEALPEAPHLDKRFIQASYRGRLDLPPDDLLTGEGLFYLTEQRRLFLDCTAGHYQMTWGYNHPELTRLAGEGMASGVVWDDHSNLPGNAVKRLSERLVQVANGLTEEELPSTEDESALNTVLLGVCTGSVAASSALKVALRHHETVRPNREPVFIVVSGNYHGTDFLAQRLRGMWEPYFHGLRVEAVEPNDAEGLKAAFRAHAGQVAAFLAEPVLMNREAILLREDFLQEARLLCDEADACLVLDEIQTAFFCPEVFMYRQYGLTPDILIVGKGMTAGFHPLAAIAYRRRYDRLEQYDAISTNGNAPLAALVALGCLALIERERDRIADVASYYFGRLQEIPAAFPETVAAIHGRGLMGGLKFRAVEAALAFHRRCTERGLWVRAHAYHAGHSTVLTKLGLLADRQIVDFLVDRFHEILQEGLHG